LIPFQVPIMVRHHRWLNVAILLVRSPVFAG
jgi:hypothetical protein